MILLTNRLLTNTRRLLQVNLGPTRVITKCSLTCRQTITLLSKPRLRQAEIRVSTRKKTTSLIPLLGDIVNDGRCNCRRRFTHLIVRTTTVTCPARGTTDRTMFSPRGIHYVGVLKKTFPRDAVITNLIVRQRPINQVEQTLKTGVTIFTYPIKVDQARAGNAILLGKTRRLQSFNHKRRTVLRHRVRRVTTSKIRMVIANSAVKRLTLRCVRETRVVTLGIPSGFRLHHLYQTVKTAPLTHLKTPATRRTNFTSIIRLVRFKNAHYAIFHRSSPTHSHLTAVILHSGARDLLSSIRQTLGSTLYALQALAHVSKHIITKTKTARVRLTHLLRRCTRAAPKVTRRTVRGCTRTFRIVPHALSTGTNRSDARTVTGLC